MADPVPSVVDNKTLQMNKKRDKKKTTEYPSPLVASPAASHSQTLILLHGRGSNADKFGPTFLKATTAEGKTLQELFPGLKVIFPTAKKRRAKWYNRATINQWFDCVPVNEQDDGMSREEIEWQIDGLRETREFLFPILDRECVAVGAKNVFIGGLSQGCAMALHLLMSWQGVGDGGLEERSKESLGGFIGMSGWLPFAKDMEAIIFPKVDNGIEEHDPFADYNDDGEDKDIDISSRLEMETRSESMTAQVCNLVRDNMDLPPIKPAEPVFLSAPVFIGHGIHDEKVKIELGRQAARLLRGMEMHVTWKEYNEGHWYKVPDEINDIVDFLQLKIAK